MKKSDQPNNINQIVYTAVAVMEKEYAEPQLCHKLIIALQCNKTKLKKGFEILLGVTPEQYLADIRMKKAAELLNRQMSISKVYMACGYLSTSEFIDEFQKHYGITPYQFLIEKTKPKAPGFFNGKK